METDLSTEDLRPHVLQQALEQISSTEDSPSGCCVICLGNVLDRCEARPCRHNHFDYICLITWLQQRPTCPLCNSKVREVQHDLTSDGKSKVYTVSKLLEDSGKSDGQTEGSNLSTLPPSRRSSDVDHSPVGSPPYEDAAIRRRRSVYRHELFSLHVGSNKRQPAELMYRELSPQLFATDPELHSRARVWLNRELRVFRHWSQPSDMRRDRERVGRCGYGEAKFLVEYIIAILKSTDLQGSAAQAEHMISQFLGRKHTRLLLHELKAWLRSPYDSPSAWDCVVQYNVLDAHSELERSMVDDVAKGTSIDLKYHEPAEARKAPPSEDCRLYVFKGDGMLEVIKLSERTVWLLGREELVVDVPTLHPSCSGQHAALQFRYTVSKESSLMTGQVSGCVKLYLIDLDSTNGTILNGTRIEARCFVELNHKDVIRFGESKREYVIIIPPG